MPLIVVCPKCSAKMRAPDNSIGRQARCPGCGDLVTITAPEGDNEPAPAPAPRRQAEDRSEAVRDAPDSPSRRLRRRDEEEDEAPRRRSRRERYDDDDDDRPRRRRRQPQEEQGLSIASLVLGCVSFLPCVCGAYGMPVTVICGILAVVLGIIGQKKGGKGMALAGIILGSVALAMAALVFILVIIGIGLIGSGVIR